MEQRLYLRELTHLYECLSLDERDDLLQCLLVAAPRGGEATVEVPEDTLLCHATAELLDDMGGERSPAGEP